MRTFSRAGAAYALFGDNTATATEQWFLGRLNQGLLLHDSLVVPEVWAITNRYLVSRIQAPDGADMLREGLIVPLRRDNATTFEAAFNRLLGAGSHGVDEGLRPYVQGLDKSVPEAVTFSLGPVMEAYRRASDTLFDYDMLVASFGVSPDGARAFLRAVEEAKGRQVDVYTNTFVFKETMGNSTPYLSGDDASRVWDVARAMYSFNIPSLLDLGVAAPDDYQGHLLVAKLRSHGAVRETSVLAVAGDDVPAMQAAFHAALGDARVHWLFSHGVIESLTSEDLLAARSTSHRGEYLARRTVFLAQPNEANWLQLVDSMQRYFSQAAEEVLRLWINTGRLGADLVDAQVSVEGDTIIRLLLPLQGAVQMAGLPDAAPETPTASIKVKPVQVVATNTQVPIVNEEV